jgi:hypothetical protein
MHDKVAEFCGHPKQIGVAPSLILLRVLFQETCEWHIVFEV